MKGSLFHPSFLTIFTNTVNILKFIYSIIVVCRIVLMEVEEWRRSGRKKSNETLVFGLERGSDISE